MSDPLATPAAAAAGTPCATADADAGAPQRKPTLLARLAAFVARRPRAGAGASGAAVAAPVTVPAAVVVPAAQPPPVPVAITLRQRRADTRVWWIGNGSAPAGTVGLALSGGGIRSATFSLGVLQALACADRLRAIDLLSTVSGGSYIGCFLRSLFLPKASRGIGDSLAPNPAAAQPSDAAIVAQYDFAIRALKSNAGVRSIAEPGPGGDEVCNPLWWLREHSRYLAPNGPTDYGYAAAYLTRNWIAMLYVFAVAAAALLALTAYGEAALWHLANHAGLLPAHATGAPAAPAPAGACDVHVVAAPGAKGSFDCPPAPGAAAAPFWRQLSPLLALALLPALVSLGLATAYWLTAQMSVNQPNVKRQVGAFQTVCLWVVVTTATIALGLWLLPSIELLARVYEYGALLLLVLEFVLALLLFGWTRHRTRPAQLLTAELRRRATSAQARVNGLLLWILAFGLVETAAAALRQSLWHDHTLKIGGLALLPALAFLIQKLPGWVGGKAGDGIVATLLRRFMPVVALGGGLLLYGVVAVFVDMLVQAAVWTRESFWSPPDLATGAMMGCTILPLALLTGLSNGFINLSSLHNLYASRLIRAYLGATNVDRLRTIVDPKQPDVGILDNHDLDYIQPSLYGELVLPAPLHIINATLNRTIDPKSQLVARDRKGELLTVEPHGVRIGNEPGGLLTWHHIGDRRVAEALSLGQWLAISGAAASSGMGRLTSLGYALAFTFANVRLGFWWWVPWSRRRELRAARGRPRRRIAPGQALIDRISTFFYLFNEMTARYSPSYKRQYLSDGGHFEDTGAYALVRRDVPRIIVCDNAEDHGYAFEDLENLVRKVRLDLQGEMTLLGGTALARFRARIGCEEEDLFVDPAATPDWKTIYRERTGRAFALAFEIVKPACDGGGAAKTLHLVLVKPRLLPGLPEDVAGYAGANPSFPQQTTGDQFFDEAQWESYRRLGQFCATRLLAACPRLL